MAGPIPALETLDRRSAPYEREAGEAPGDMPVAVSAHRAALFYDLARNVEPVPGTFEPKVLERPDRCSESALDASG